MSVDRTIPSAEAKAKRNDPIRPNVFAILTFGGVGNRFGWHKPKQFYPFFEGRTVLQFVVRKFLTAKLFQRIVVVTNADWLGETEAELAEEITAGALLVVAGGSSRERSVWNGLLAVDKYAKDDDIILVHDGARPLVSRELLRRNLEACERYDAVVTAVVSTDTVTLSPNSKVQTVLRREEVHLHQTPQTFRYRLLRRAMEEHQQQLDMYSDEATLLASCGVDVYYIEGERTNIKITTLQDALVARMLLEADEMLR